MQVLHLFPASSCWSYLLLSKGASRVKNLLAKLSVCVGAAAYALMVYSIIIGTGEGLSLSTFALWAALAWITSFTMLKQGANAAVPMIYGLGASATTLVLLYKGRYGWTGFDTVIAILTTICVVLWLTQGARKALIMSVIAAAIASIPFVVMTWQTPASSPIVPNTGFLLSNILAFVAAKAWTVEDRLYSAVNICVCSMLVIPWVIQ